MVISDPKYTPEQLVGIGFRGWLAGYEYQDIACWEAVWKIYVGELGSKQAKRAVMDLSAWVRIVRQTACRPIRTLPLGCLRFCEDERLAICVVAACQHKQCPALRSCAFALLGSSHIDAMIDEVSDFATLLTQAGQNLEVSSVRNITCADVFQDPNSTRH